MTGFDQTRRGLIAGLAATGPLAACATALPSPRRMIQVNLTDTPLPPVTAPSPPPPAPDTALQAGFDPVQRMTVPVMVEGKGPFTFVVDTGANHSVLAAETAQGLNLPSGGTAAIHGIAGVEPAETVYVRQMIIGSVVTKRLRMPLVSRRNLGADGLLGVDVLTRRDVQLDFERNRFNIARSDSSFRQVATTGGTGRLATPMANPNLVVVPARYRFGQLTIIDAEVGVGLPITAFLDSGAQSTVGNLALRNAAFLQEPGLALKTLRVQLVSATGQTVSGDLARLPGLRLGGLRIGNLSCVFADLHTFKIWDLVDRPAILIGMDVMRHFKTIELDFGRREVVFETGAKASPSAVGLPASAPPS
ncbi:aspartyl protease family protein [Phenylobacterium sp. 20VBR1]|uniref:Aspartyl protease family protein n=1 Tax=Phenylobacterium glaciei TaxID=2803784 RepID=A0A941HY26_9CAUL|nr:retroviral-like aspartic protease family protein [Phenylobacterium glaciei]MBR7620927.1 aspartyl protease family protein [Phenylobacterium glaciei]